MKNKIKIFLFTLAVVAAGCNKQVDNTNSIGCGKVYISKNEFVSLCIAPYEVSENSENKRILKNHTERVLEYGMMFSLDYFDNGEWVPVDLTNQPWNEIGLSLGPGKTSEGYTHTILLYCVKEYNNSQKGKYRMGKRYGYLVDSTVFFPREWQSIIVYAEFVIK